MSGTKIRRMFPGGRKAARRPKVNDPDRQSAASPLGRTARMLALAYHVERLIEAGELSGYSEAARSLGLTRGRFTQIMGLLLLAPEIQALIGVGELVLTERALRCVLADPVWEQQRAILELG